jgi:hypothetical protein
MSVNQRDHLLVGLCERVIDCGLSFFGDCASANVIYALKDHGVADTRMSQDVTVDTSKCVGSKTVGENAVSTSRKVAEGDVLGGW